MVNTMRKMHVPAYCPIVLGVHSLEKRGVSVALKNTMFIPIDEFSMSISMLDVAAAAVDMVEVAMPGIVDMSILRRICCTVCLSVLKTRGGR